jgi:cell division septum initiation protein DivIVA
MEDHTNQIEYTIVDAPEPDDLFKSLTQMWAREDQLVKQTFQQEKERLRLDYEQSIEEINQHMLSELSYHHEHRRQTVTKLLAQEQQSTGWFSWIYWVF